MAPSMKKQLAKVDALSKFLNELENKLEPMLSKPLSETMGSLDALQQAKLHVVLSYLINDLVFIYLKTRDVDPKTHPVATELDRVRQYFGKIKDAEESNKKRTTEIDKAAAGRFIKHAISEARQNIVASSSTNVAGPSNSQPSTVVPVRMTEKMREREEYHRKLAEESDDEEAVLDIIDNAAEDKASKVALGKRKAVARSEIREVADSVQAAAESGKKKRQRPMDPFDSFPEEPTQTADSGEKPRKKKNHKKIEAIIDNDADSRASSDADVSGNGPSPKKKKTKKKDRKAAN